MNISKFWNKKLGWVGIVSLMGASAASVGLVTFFVSKSAEAQDSAADPAVELDPLERVDHYRCYRVDEEHDVEPDEAFVWDQFTYGWRKVLRVRSICAPSYKYHNNAWTVPIGGLDGVHLVCYDVEPKVDAEAYVEVRNQFGVRRMKVREEETLCVPSHKRHLDG